MKRQTSKDTRTPEQAHWQQVITYAQELGLDALESAQEGTFSLAGYGVAISFPRTLQGMQEALEWMEKFEQENFE